jgi:peptidoglycan/xylan/chitin deacetylase (PgdA/CDA1 family)
VGLFLKTPQRCPKHLGDVLIRDLPRGQFGVYLQAHYPIDRSGALPRFSMGCGVIFMIQRVAAQETSLMPREAIGETDPQLLQEMLSLISAQRLEVISLAEVRRRLAERDLDRKFVCFTFDGAYRSIKDGILPMFEQRGIPFTVFAGSDYLDGRSAPWWLLLEALVKHADRIFLQIGDEAESPILARSHAEKRLAYAKLFRGLKDMDAAERARRLEAEMTLHGIEAEGVARREMLSRDDLRGLAQSELVTIGTMGGGNTELPDLSYDQARENLSRSIEILESATGQRPCDLAFASGTAVAARDIEIARDLGLASAVTQIEGSLWPEHARELLALPRIALDNDPATLVRALMLSGGATPGGGTVFQKAI